MQALLSITTRTVLTNTPTYTPNIGGCLLNIEDQHMEGMIDISATKAKPGNILGYDRREHMNITIKNKGEICYQGTFKDLITLLQKTPVSGNGDTDANNDK